MLNGTWAFSLKTPVGDFTMDLHLQTTGVNLTGYISGKINSCTELTNVTHEGNRITFQAALKTPLGLTDTTTIMTISGDSMQGTTLTKFGTVPATAVKRDDNDTYSA